MTNPDVRAAVPAPTRAPAVDHFLAAVAQECADLAPADRGRLLDGLAEHLAELSADGVDVVADLGDPAAYAAELRASAGLPTAPTRRITTGSPAAPAAPPAAQQPPRRGIPVWAWVVAALAAVVAVGAFVVVVLGLTLFTVAGSPVEVTSAPAQPSFRASPAAVVMVPDVTGMPGDAAIEVLESVGLQVAVSYVSTSSPDESGRALSQEPVAGSEVLTGSTVTLVLGE